MATSIHSGQLGVQRTVVPDSVLENYTCQSCNKYLTVGPVGLHPGGGNVCGRCIDKKRNRSALFEINGSDYHQICNDSIPIPILAYATSLDKTFPCVNRYEGCREVLRYSEVELHENACAYGVPIDCPIPGCLYRGIGSQLMQHYKKDHRTLYLEEPKFLVSLNRDYACHYIYRQNGILFFVTNKFSRDRSTLQIHFSQLSRNEGLFSQVCLKMTSLKDSSEIVNTSNLFDADVCTFNFDDVVELLDHNEALSCEFSITSS